MKNDDLKINLSSLSLNQQEESLVKSTMAYKTTIPFIIILVLGGFLVWFKHFNIFKQNIFFMIYNVTVYLGIMWAAIWTYYYQKKVSRLFVKLITIINTRSKVV